jgi:hypothetical protein
MSRRKTFRNIVALPFLALACCFSYPHALTRMAIFIGNNRGLDSETPLQYAIRDAQQVNSVLLELDGIDKGYSYQMLNSSLADVQATLASVRERAKSLHAQGERVQLLIYFSGHGSNDGLHMNGKVLPVSDIRSYFKSVEADLKLLVADACFSGALIQAKGAALSDPVPVHYANQLNVNGSAILTSSSAGEFSQESKDLQGSLFTHYLISALRGAADFDRDGRVTLWEAYSLTAARMHHKSVSGSDFMQTPAFDVNIKGSNDVVLTRLDPGEASLVLRGLPEGEYRVLDAVNGIQAAEVILDGSRTATLALPRSAYKVYHQSGGEGREAYADLRRDRRVELGIGDMKLSEKQLLALKGTTAKGISGEGISLDMQSRFYPAFPGREGSSLAWNTSLHWRHGDWDALLSYGLLPKSRSASWASATEQSAQSLALEGRYYWLHTWLMSAYAGPRVESWWVEQSVDQSGMDAGQLLGSFAVAGIEKNFFRHLSLDLAVNGGAFLKSEADGALAWQPAFPVSASLRFGW